MFATFNFRMWGENSPAVPAASPEVGGVQSTAVGILDGNSTPACVQEEKAVAELLLNNSTHYIRLPIKQHVHDSRLSRNGTQAKGKKGNINTHTHSHTHTHIHIHLCA
jgi:hypothetical protein